MTFQPIKNQKIYHQVAEQILQMIASGELEPGARLPTERQLAEAMSVSRPSVREALAALELMGVVEMRRGQGTFVCTARGAEERAYRALNLVEGEESPLEILEARRALERETAKLAALRATSEDLEEMRRYLTLMRQQLDNEGMFDMQHDRSLHLAIAEAAQSHVLRQLNRIALDLTKQRLWLTMRNRSHEIPGLPEKYHRQHEAIVDAIAREDAGNAEQHVIDHITSVQADIFGDDGKG